MDILGGLTHEQVLYLKTYDYVKKNAILQKLAEELDAHNMDIDPEMKSSIDQTVHRIGEEIINYTLSKHALVNEGKIQLKQVRVYMDGVFDIIHSGHFNALRQGKKLGDILVLGVNSDEDVFKAKGPTLMDVHERAALVGACKWVDEVHLNTPYTPTLELLDQLNIDFCVHGDDPCFNELGQDVYAEMKKKGRFKMFKRTEGISTTDIIGRLLTLTKQNTGRASSLEGQHITSSDLLKQSNDETFVKGPVVSCFLTTGWRLQEFCNQKVPQPNDRVVYIDGAWDILHIGHIETLKKAKEMGDFVYVGVHDDQTVNTYRGKNYPLLNLQERVFNLLALRYVDDVVIGAPWALSADLIRSLKITKVLHGTSKKFDENYEDIHPNDDPYTVAKTLGIYEEIESKYDLTSEILVKRIFDKRDFYVKKYEKKSKSEQGYYQNKEYVDEI